MCCRVYDSPSPEVGERVRAYLEQHGWPEEYEAESLLEHYALGSTFFPSASST